MKPVHAGEPSVAGRMIYAFWKVAPVFVSMVPIGLLFGALSVENGLSVAEAVLFSALVFAGASQMVGIELFGQMIPAWLVVFSIFAVNFRHVLYSASIGTFMRYGAPWKRYFASFLMVDPVYALAEQAKEQKYRWGFAEYLGSALPLYVAWIFVTWLGARFGQLIENPEELGLKFLMPLYFMGLVMSFRHRHLWLPIVVVSGTTAYLAILTIGSPWHVSLGAVAGVLTGAIFGVKPDEQQR